MTIFLRSLILTILFLFHEGTQSSQACGADGEACDGGEPRRDGAHHSCHPTAFKLHSSGHPAWSTQSSSPSEPRTSAAWATAVYNTK